MLFGRLLEEDICPSIDEEPNIGGVGPLSSTSDAIDLSDCFTEFSVRWKAILDVAAHSSRVDRQCKPVTATATMRLMEEGKIDFDVPANEYLKQFQIVPFPGDSKGPSVRGLLMHRSGLPIHWQSWNLEDLKLRPAFVETVRQYAFAAWPRGERYEYSNLGYGVLGELIAQVFDAIVWGLYTRRSPPTWG